MVSEPTQIKPRTRDESSLVPVPASVSADVEPAAYQRAPTLMAGASAGSQGQVQVWAPSRKLLWFLLTASLAAVAFTLVFGVLTRQSVIWILAFVYFSLAAAGGFFASLRALRRPGYVTTDDTGMAVTTRTGSVPLQWTEIKAIRAATELDKVTVLAPDRVELNAQGRIDLHLTGYPTNLRKDLLVLMVGRTGLHACFPSGVPLNAQVMAEHPGLEDSCDPRLFIRPGYTVFNNWCERKREISDGREQRGSEL